MTKPYSPYRQIIIETFLDSPRGKRSSIRARAISGQFYSSDLNISCSTAMRDQHAVGTRFRVSAKESVSCDGASFLYVNPHLKYDVIP
jgi:hypothetical protein